MSYLEEEGSLGETSDEGLVFVLGDHTIQNEVIAWLVPSPSLVGSHTGEDILDWLRWLRVPDSSHRSIFRWSLNEVTQQPIKDKLLLSIYSQLCGTVWRN